MALLCCSCSPPISSPVKVNQSWHPRLHRPTTGRERSSTYALMGADSEFFGQNSVKIGRRLGSQWSFVGGSRVIRPTLSRYPTHRKGFIPSASWITTSQIANNVFTLGTVAVLPFYTLMVLAPNAQLTKKTMESSVPFVMLGILYAYLLYLSWTPSTLQLMFASKYWLPELSSISKMFANEMTLASAWIHLLAVDLFAARYFMMV
ncbi:hypothetical protein QJS10_CPA01g01467 [Acorus calamus]|uniref:Uncharacterized protein n=1 Tax=Acorus calamus TaxID=4465 RepID=A0AAV9FHB4_ACOCL|nr:hypothetical protein QJS10_CPA01g01467 [Acorus calamus]